MVTIEDQVGVHYAYPDSAQAHDLGRGSSGVWYVRNGYHDIVADGPRHAAKLAEQMIAGGIYDRSPMCMTNATTWPNILARFGY
jgi:hypothetical protein